MGKKREGIPVAVLIETARQRAEAKGHQLPEFQAHPHRSAVRVAQCGRCLRTAAVREEPDGREGHLSGECFLGECLPGPRPEKKPRRRKSALKDVGSKSPAAGPERVCVSTA